MLQSLLVLISLTQSKIDHIDHISVCTLADQEVCGLYISVNEVLTVNCLKANYNGIKNKENSLKGEFSVAKVKKVLQ